MAAPSTSREFAEAIVWYYDRPVEFAIDIIGVDPDLWQTDFLNAIRDNRKVAVAGCTGSGKDAAISWGILWFLATRPFAKIPCTAPSLHLLLDVLWAELHKWIRHSAILEQLFDWTKTAIRHRAYPEEWFAVARTGAVNISQNGMRTADGLGGFHGDHLMFVIDEGSGVETPNFEAAEGTLTGDENKLIVIGNPLRTEGRFFEIFSKPALRRNWATLHVGAVDRPEVPLSWNGQRYVAKYANTENAFELIETYGESSPIVQARVFAQFPTVSSTDTTFSYYDVMSAFARELVHDETDDWQFGVDCSRFGDDETVFCIRHGFEVLPMIGKHKTNTLDIVGTIKELCEKYPDPTRPYWKNRAMCCVDEGLGEGVVDMLWNEGYENVFAVNFGNSARDKERFNNVAAEMWMKELFDFMPRARIAEDDRLLNQLITRKYAYTGMGLQRRLEAKPDMKRRGLPSPDRADALCLAVHQPVQPNII